MIPFCKTIVKFLTSRNRQANLLLLHILMKISASVFHNVSETCTENMGKNVIFLTILVGEIRQINTEKQLFWRGSRDFVQFFVQ